MPSNDKTNENELREVAPTYTVGGLDVKIDIEQLNRGYVCPANAGPAWRAAHEYGLDLSLLEESLQMTEEERLADHQLALNRVLRFTSDEHASAK